MRNCVVVVAVLVCLCLYAVDAAEVNCTHTSSKGDFYDLSPLSKCDLSGYAINDNSGFVLNVCNTVKSTCTNANAAVCQNGLKYTTGDNTKVSFSDLAGIGKGVTLTYGGGDGGCPNGVSRSTKLNFICDATAFPDPHVEFISETPQCTYNFAIKSKYACPVKVAPQINWCKTEEESEEKKEPEAKAATINVFLVPHTHDDVGWQVTVDQYYTGQVRNILNSVTESLAANPARKFVYVEQAFFTRWWYDGNVTDAQRNSLRNSYNKGQLEFVIGGWTMQDGACTTYGADIEQMTIGHQFLLNTFGARPTKGWQLDPFGSGVVTGTLQKLAGFDAHLIDRITDKSYYGNTQTLQFLWQGVPSLGKEGEIFTEIMDGNANAYCDFYFTLNFDSNPVNNNNVATYANNFINMVRERVPHFKTNNILAAWGCDFAFTHATNNFASMDVLMAYMKANEGTTGIHVQYATVSDYFDAVKASSGSISWPVNVGADFFTYNDGGVWSGYFSSRTVLKGLVRQGEATSHASEQIYSLGRKLASGVDAKTGYNQIYSLRDANGEATHHDGVTGTSTMPVVTMYLNDLKNGIQQASMASENILGRIISASTPPKLDHTLQDVINIKAGQTIAVVLYNSLGWDRTEIVTLPTNNQNVMVHDATGKTMLPAQISQSLLSNAQGKYNIFFEATIPALGYVTYLIIASASTQSSVPVVPLTTFVMGGADETIANKYVSLVISGDTGRIKSFTNIGSSVNINLDQEVFQYTAEDPSGAYVFKPSGLPTSVSKGAPPKTVISQGKLVTEVYQVYATGTPSSYASQVIRLYQSSSADAAYVEITAQAGVLPSHIEVISHFSTNINNGATFYSDDNGFEYIQRTNTYPLYGIEFQHYPSIYSSFIQDVAKNVQFSVISDRSHSVSSLANGELEIMLHRNPVSQDNKGLGGLYTDTDVAYPTLRVILDTIEGSKLNVKKQSYGLNFPLVPFSSVVTNNNWSGYKTSGQFIKAALPPQIHFQSLNALENNSTRAILRLTHTFAVGEHPTYSKPATVDISTLFAGVTIKKIDENTLTANKVTVANAPSQVTLTPKQIRTFIIDFN